MIDVCRLCSSFHLFICSIPSAVADIFADRTAVEPRILQHHAEHLPQISPGEISDIVIVHPDTASIQLIEAHQQLDDGRLAGARRSDDSDTLTRLCRKAEIVDDRFIGIISK